MNEIITNIAFVLSIVVLPITYLLAKTMVDTRMNKQEIDDLHQKVAKLQREIIQKEIDKYE